MPTCQLNSQNVGANDYFMGTQADLGFLMNTNEGDNLTPYLGHQKWSPMF